jgi:dihydroneopterin aldolase
MKAEIALVDLEFYAYHGFYEEERKTGNRFSVDVKVETFMEEDRDFKELGNTVNYEELYEIVKEHMLVPALLLEEIAHKILQSIFTKWEQSVTVSVSISKFTPPIGGVCKKAMVTLTKAR